MSSAERETFTTVAYEEGSVRLLDQTQLPQHCRYRECRTVDDLVDSIRRLRVRGAPALGVAAAYGVVLAAAGGPSSPGGTDLAASIRNAISQLRAARPTAVNLGWALDRMERALTDLVAAEAPDLHAGLWAEATAIHREDETLCRNLGRHAAALLPDPAVVMTHCNTGALATGGMGTALAGIYAAVEAGKRVEVIATETRPLLQGARLTAWELLERRVPVTLICDGAAGWTMRQRRIDAVMLGADRIAANGDVANKIGTYNLAVLAARHGIPFYVVAPYSTLDLRTPSGEAIPIELRDPAEVKGCLGTPTAPAGVEAFNPAFDVTPADLIHGIVTERGVLRPPFGEAFGRQYGTA
jgi:methylthioribose-1-phosphate isomerase